MERLKVYHVDAFADQAFGGNPAGVVPDATELTEVKMQQIAKELNLSETAFLFPQDATGDVHFKVRYFTPTKEIDFCGHATLGSAWLLATEYGWINKTSIIKIDTAIGLIPVELRIEDNKLSSAMMTQLQPKTKSIDTNKDDIAAMIGVAVEDIDQNLPIKIAYTGNWHLVVPVKSRQAIDNAKPNLTRLGSHNVEHGIVTTHLFTFDSQETACLLYTRDFAPAVGIAEDPVTGSANGALAGYLIVEKIIDPRETSSFTVAQGHATGRPGYLDIEVNEDQEIKVGGKAVLTIAGELLL